MLNEKELCSKCNKRPVQNKFHKLCSECNYKRTHNGKSRFMVYREKSIEKQKKTQLQPIKKKQVKHKATGEKSLFLEIWQERKHYCEKGSECKNAVNNKGCWLGNEPKAWMFSHIKSKSTHPELRLVKSNIELICWDCHYTHEFM